MAEAAFSEDGKYYSAISQDGRLRIWDTETNVLKQEYTPNLHLTSPPSCLQWITVATSTNSAQKSKRKLSGAGAETPCLAVGTTSGVILIYSVAQAKVQTVLDDNHSENQNRKITCLDWNRKSGLFSCHKNNVIFEWKLDIDKKHKYNVSTDFKNKQVSTISAMKIIPHSMDTNAHYVITASWQLRVWRLHEGTATTLKCLGHNTSQQSILAIARTSEKTWVVEGSQTERLLSIWDVTVTEDIVPQTNGEEPTPNKKKRRKSSSAIEVQTVTVPSYNFVLEDAPKMIDVVAKEDRETKLTLAAVTRSGVVHYYVHTLNGASKKPIKPTLTLHMTTGGATPLPLLCCRLAEALLVGYTQGAALVFEHVTPDLSSKTQVLIRGDSKPKKIKVTTNEVNKVVSDTNKDVQYVEPMGGVTRKRAAPGAKLEVPMEARLANLSLDTATRDQSAVNQNLTRLLVQGLHSKDDEILELVLNQATRGAAARTAAQLPAEYLPALLQHLAALANKRTHLCGIVCTWVGAILRAHAALLLASMSSQHADQLTALLTTFTNRRSHLCQLLNLKGRLDLTLAQRLAPAADAADQDPIIDYNDTSDEEIEVERQSNASSFDDQFDDSDHSDQEESRDDRDLADLRDTGDSDSGDSGGSE